MRKIVFSPEAINDLEEIWLYIAPGIIIVVEHKTLVPMRYAKNTVKSARKNEPIKQM